MKSKRICLLFLIYFSCLKNAASEGNEDGNFLVVSTSPSPATQKYSKLEEKLLKVEQKLEFLTALKVNDLFEEQNGQIRKLSEKFDALPNNSKQILQLLEEMKAKEIQQDKTLADLPKNLEDSFKSQLEVMKQQMLKFEEQLQFLTTKVSDSFEEHNEQIEKLLEKQMTCENNTKKIVKLLEETKEKQLQEEKTLAELSKKLEELEIAKIKEDLSVPKDCKDVQYKKSNLSGVYSIQPANARQPFMVWCDMETRGGGWVYVLNRFDGSVNFSRNWIDYKEGFGDLRGELWLGLEYLHELTSSEPNELLVELSDWNDRKGYAIYSHFEIGNEDEGYKFKKWGTYSGTAGNSMEMAYGQKFSTPDNDQDNTTGNCASDWDAGWWYKSCFDGLLTGKYFNDAIYSYTSGIYWSTFVNLFRKLKTAKMMIRPIK